MLNIKEEYEKLKAKGDTKIDIEQYNSTVMIINCILENNSADLGGGMLSKSISTIENCIFRFNQGGGIYTRDVSPSIANCIFDSNISNNN